MFDGGFRGAEELLDIEKGKQSVREMNLKILLRGWKVSDCELNVVGFILYEIQHRLKHH